MTTEQQAYIEGFVKRASEYGYRKEEAVNILKEASFGKMLGKIPRTPFSFLHNVNHGVAMKGYNSMIREFPELAHGANIDAISKITDLKDIHALSEITGKSPYKVQDMINNAGQATSFRDYIRDMKKNLLDELPGPLRPGFKHHARSEALSSLLAKKR